MHWESKPQPRFGDPEERDSYAGDRFGDSFGGYGGSGTSWGSNNIRSYRDTESETPRKPLESTRRTTASASSSAPMMQLNQGDMVEHTAFGRGMVLSVRAMGGDALVEVAFDNVGTKKLMLKSAGKHMQKL